MKNTKRLSLEDFKGQNVSRNIERIAGGILGDCHCYTTVQTGGGCTSRDIVCEGEA